MNASSLQLQPLSRLPELLDALARQLQFLQDQILALQTLVRQHQVLDEVTLARLRRIYRDMADLPEMLKQQLLYWDTLAVTPVERRNLEVFAQCISVFANAITVVLEITQSMRGAYSA